MSMPRTVLRVDLSSETIEKEPLPERLQELYVGGRGINVKLLFDEMPPGADSLGPENRLVFGAGLLSGTAAPCPARFNVTGRSPLTGIVGDSNAGGHFGPALRRAGIDHVVFSGKAAEPVYLWIDNGRAELRKARHLWGKTTRAAEAAIRDELGDRRVRVAAMGPAGENLVRYANVIHQERSAARTGMGAVMGSKNLKAVAVRGSGTVALHDPEGFNSKSRDLMQAVAASNEYGHFKNGSASAGVYVTGKKGFLAVRNFELAGGFEGIEEFNPQKVVEKYYHGKVRCFGCPIGCGRKFRINDGPYAGEWGVKIEEGAFGPVGPVCGNANMDSIFKMNNMGNQLGLDMQEFGQAMAVLMDLHAQGVISEKDTDGIPMTWGNHESLIAMMEKVASREGIGDVLAEGIVRAAPHFGSEAMANVSHAKGMVLPAMDPRMLKGTALGFATSTRGADHLRGLVLCEFMPIMSPEEARQRFGTAAALEHGSYEKAAPTIYYQHLALIPDLLEVCRFLLGMGQGTGSFGFNDIAELYCLATGRDVGEEGLLEIAERVYNTERAFACREGCRRVDDHLHGKWSRGPVPSGPFKGEELDPQRWEEMLDEYYRLRGWSNEGVPTQEKLQALGVSEVARSLEVAGVYARQEDN